MVVFDASALLAMLREEPGALVVEQALIDGGACGAANWSEVVQKALQAGRDITAMSELFDAYGLAIEPVTRADADWAANCWLRRPSLSLGDRLCLALADRLGVPVLTADSSWGTNDGVRQIR